MHADGMWPKCGLALGARPAHPEIRVDTAHCHPKRMKSGQSGHPFGVARWSWPYHAARTSPSPPPSSVCVCAREHFSFSIPLPDCFTKSGRTVSSGIFSMLVQLFGCMILTALVRFCSRQQLGLPIFFVRCPE